MNISKFKNIVFLSFFKAFLSAAIFGSITTIIIKLYQGAEELKEMKQSVHDFIKHHRISKQLEKQMQESFDHEWKNTKGIDMNSILKIFPECIQADICLHLNRELLNNCPVFEDASEGIFIILFIVLSIENLFIFK